MLSYYPKMSGDDDTTGTQVCDVDRHGNLVRCHPYIPPASSAHGWEFDGSSGFGAAGGGGGHGGGGGGGGHAPSAPAAPSSPMAAIHPAGFTTSANAAHTAAVAAAARSSHPTASPAQRGAVGTSAVHAARPGYPTPPRTTRDFVQAQRASYGRGFRPRGYGYAGIGLQPRPWNDPFYYQGVGLIEDPMNPLYAEAVDYDGYDDDDDFFGADYMAMAKHEVATHKPEVLGVSLGALGAYVGGPLGAIVGGVAGFIGGKVLGL
jgi:hypothetical protein